MGLRSLIYFLSILLVSALPVLAWPTQARAFSEDEIRQHVDALINSHPSWGVRKWRGRIGYLVVGAISYPEASYLVEKMNYLAELAGEEVEFERFEESEATKAKMFFIFVDQFQDFQDTKFVQSLFRESGQTEAEFRQELREPKIYVKGRFGSNSGQLGLAAIMMKVKGLSAEERKSRMFEAAFAATIGTLGKSDYKPSIASKPPHKTIVTDRLPTLDELYVVAFYSARVVPGMEKKKAAARVTDLILERLGQ